MIQETPPLPADVVSERAVLLIALQPGTGREGLNGTGTSHFTGLIRPLLWKLADEMRHAGAPLSIEDLERAYLKQPDHIRVPPAVAQVEFDALRETFAYAGNLEYFMAEINKAAAKRKSRRTTESIQRAIDENAEPEEILRLINQLPEDARGLETHPTPAALMPLTAKDYDPDEKVPVALGMGDEILAAEGDAIILGADSGAGKTILMQTIAVARSLGHSVLGFDTGQRVRVGVIASDGDGPRPTAHRIVRILRGFGKGADELDGPFLRVFAVPDFCLDRSKDFQALEYFLQEFDPADLYLDSLGSLAGPERNRWDDGVMGDFIRSRVRSLQVRPDGSWRTLWLSHHLRKPSSSGDKAANSIRARLAGSYAILRAVDVCIGLEATGPESFIARCVKRSRWGSSFRDFLTKIEGGPEEPLTLANQGALQPTKAEAIEAEDAFLEAASAQEEGSWFKAADIAKSIAPRFNLRTVQRAGVNLADAGRLERHPKIKGRYRLRVAGES